ncbi:MAG: hypothetical protein WCM93_16745 [Bacteroidota bacterium]
MKKIILLISLAFFSTISFSQRTWINPTITANLQIIDNNVQNPAGLCIYVEVLTTDGNYSTWYNDTYPVIINASPGSYNVQFHAANPGIQVWKPNPLPMNYYLVNFRCEKWRNGSLICRTNEYRWGQLDTSNNLVVGGTVVLTLP